MKKLGTYRLSPLKKKKKKIMSQRNGSGPFLTAASYDITISVTDLSNETAAFSTPMKFGLQNAQANRIIGLTGSRFAVASNPYIFVYDRTAKTNKPVMTFQGHQTNVTDLCTDGTKIYSCSEDETWKVYDTAQPNGGRAIASYQTNCCLNAITLLCDNKCVLTGNDRGQIELWSVADGKQLQQLRVSQSPVRSLAPSGNEGLVIVGCQDGNVVIVKVDENSINIIKSVKAHDEILTRVAASPDGKLFATASADSTAKLWYVDSCELKAKLADPNQTRWIWDVAFTPDSQRICTGGTDKVCRVWDVNTGELKKQVEWHQKGVTCIAIIQ